MECPHLQLDEKVVSDMYDLCRLTHSLSLSLSLLTYRCVYERSPIAPTLVTFTLSAIWHGFYPGYYFTFIFFGIETEAARKVQCIHVTCKPNNYYAMIIILFSQIRRLVRPYFQGSLPLKWCYHVATWTATRMLLDFGTLPFEFMWMNLGLCFWWSVSRTLCIIATPPPHINLLPSKHTGSTTIFQWLLCV